MKRSILLVFAPMISMACETQFLLDSQLEMQKPDANKSSVYDLQATLSLKSVTLDHQKGWWAIKADNVIAKGTNPSDYIELPFAFKLDNQGLITEYWYPRLLSREKEESLIRLATYYQFLRSPKDNQIVQERESGLSYTYVYKTEADSHVLHKSKKNVVEGALPDNLKSMNILYSSISIKPDNCFFTEQVGEEVTDTRSHFNQLSFVASHYYSLIKQKQMVASTLFSLPNELSEWDIIKDVEISDEELEEQAKKLNRWVTRGELDSLKVHQLSKELEEYENALNTLTDTFLGDSLSKEKNMKLLTAIGLMDSRQSHEFLIGIVGNSKMPDSTRFRALHALKYGDNRLSPEATDLIQELVENDIETDSELLRGSFMPVIGLVIAGRPDDDNKRSLISALENKLLSEDSPAKKGQLLISMGNTKEEKLIYTIQSYTKDESSYVRGNAAYALGQLGTPDAYHQLSTMLHRESNNDVRKEVFRAFKKHEINSDDIHVVTALIATSSDPTFRKEGIAALSAQKKALRVPELNKLLNTEKDPENLRSIVNSIHSD